MAWLPMYLLREDVEFLNDWLNQEEEIAFLVSNGNKKWIAKKQHDIHSDIGTQDFGEGYNFKMPNYVEYNLWHISSGQLPLLGEFKGAKLRFSKTDNGEDGKVLDPWAGWTEIRTGANPRVPYFGSGHPGIIHLQIKKPQTNEIPISCFGWIGNHYKIIGSAADASTEKFWSKLRRMAKKIGTHIPRSNETDRKKEIYAFPTAYKEIKNGRPCSLN